MKNFIVTLVVAGNMILGTVIDKNTNERLTGVKIATQNEVVYSDFDGNFQLNKKDTLQLSFISYKDTIVVLQNQTETSAINYSY